MQQESCTEQDNRVSNTNLPIPKRRCIKEGPLPMKQIDPMDPLGHKATIVAKPVLNESSSTDSIVPVPPSSNHNTKPMAQILSQEKIEEIIPDYNDTTLPISLRVLFQEVYCSLCNVQLSSTIVAKLHYKGTAHEKRVRKFLTDYAENTGEPLHPRTKKPPPQPKEDMSDEKYYYCTVCDLPLTSRVHAESHYNGRNHKRVVLGHKTPAGKGFYGIEGKWVRLPNKTYSTNNSIALTYKTVLGAKGPSVLARPVASKSLSVFRCDWCKVSVTSVDQLEKHYLGQKHRKRLRYKATFKGPYGSYIRPPPILPVTSLSQAVLVVPSPVPSPPAEVPPKDDGLYTRYRLPSGKYYCQCCNQTINSQAQLRQHLQNKDHLEKAQTLMV